MTRTLWSGADEVGEYTSAGVVLRRFIPDGSGGMDARLAMVQPVSGQSVDPVHWFHTDHQGSVVAMSNDAGQASGFTNYTPYGGFGTDTSGNALTSTPNGNPFGYTGRQWDPKAGLYQYRARYYHPGLGIFLSHDPIGTKDDPNLNGYVGQDPVNRTDPTGRTIVIHGSETYKRQVNAAIRRIEQGRGGRAFIRELRNHRREIVIQAREAGDRGNNADARDERAARREGVGSDVDVFFDPTDHSGGMNDNGSTRRAPFVGLAHELGHAEDMIKGRDGPRVRDSEGRRQDHTPEREGNAIMRENMVRGEHGLTPRSNWTSPSQRDQECVSNPLLRRCQ